MISRSSSNNNNNNPNNSNINSNRITTSSSSSSNSSSSSSNSSSSNSNSNNIRMNTGAVICNLASRKLTRTLISSLNLTIYKIINNSSKWIYSRSIISSGNKCYKTNRMPGKI